MEISSIGEFDSTPKSERLTLEGQHFNYVLVMGQGPVQEAEKVPQTGREGLNLYSRLIALSAAEMLKQKITDKVVLSGGETGSRKGTPEAKTEAELMADIIRRKLTKLSEDKMNYRANGQMIPIYNEQGARRPQNEIESDIKKAYEDKILIENEARYTLENFTLTLNKYIDPNPPGDPRYPHAPKEHEKPTLAILGIGFHAHNTHNDADKGRLEALAEIFQIEGPTYSAEEVLQQFVVDNKKATSYVGSKLSAILDTSENDDISKLKSELENFYVQGLRRGDWIQVVNTLKNPQRIRAMLKNDIYVRKAFQDQLGITDHDIEEMDLSVLLDNLKRLEVLGCPNYEGVKKRIADTLVARSQETGTNYYGKYVADTKIDQVLQGTSE